MECNLKFDPDYTASVSIGEGRDLLGEVGRIQRKSHGAVDPLCPLATSAHLDAVVQLVREAKAILDGAEDVSLVDWLKAAEKVLSRRADIVLARGEFPEEGKAR